jgi:hypothetical protein
MIEYTLEDSVGLIDIRRVYRRMPSLNGNTLDHRGLSHDSGSIHILSGSSFFTVNVRL